MLVRRFLRLILPIAVMAVVVVGGSSTAGAASPSGPASTAALTGCSYPYVCVYTGSQSKIGQFQQVTSYWQYFSRNDVTYAKNTRNDDVAYFLYSSGRTSCVAPGQEAYLPLPNYGTVTAIRISTEAVCYG